MGVITAASAICLVGALLLILSLSPGEKFIKGVLESQLADGLGQPVTIGRLETNVLSRLVMNDVSVRDTLSPGRESILAVHEIRIAYRLLPLISRRVSITSVSLDTITLHLSRDVAGRFNIPVLNDTVPATTDSAASGGSPMTISLGAIDINAVKVIYDDEFVPVRIAMHGGSLTLQGESFSSSRFDFRADSISASYDNFPIDAVGLRVLGDVTDSVLTLDTIHLVAENLILSARGTLGLDSLAAIEAAVHVSSKPGRLLETAGAMFGLPDARIDGTISMDVEARGRVASPYLTASLMLPPVSIAGADLDGGRIVARWHDDSLLIDSLQLAIFDGNISGAAGLSIDTIPAGRLELSLADIDISSVWEYSYGEPSPYAGRLHGSAAIAGEGRDIAGWGVDAALQATRATYNSQPFPDFSSTVRFGDGRGRIRIAQDDFDIEADGQFDGDRIDITCNIDVARLEPLAGLFNLMELTGAVKASGKVTGTVDNPDLTATIHAENLRFQNFPVDSFKAEVRYRDSILHIDRVEFSGRLDSIGPGRPMFHIDSLAGGISYHVRAAGTTDSLLGRFRSTFHDLRYRGYSLDSGRVDARIDGRALVLDSAVIYQAPGYIRAGGWYNLDHADGDMRFSIYYDSAGGAGAGGELHATFNVSDTSMITASASGSRIDIGHLARFVSDSLEVGGVLDFAADFSGTVANPRLEAGISVTHPSHGQLALDSLICALGIDDDIVLLDDGRIYGYGNYISVNGAARYGRDSTGAPVLTEESLIRGEIRAQNLDLQAFNPLLEETAILSGTAGMELRWDGTIETPHIRGTITLDDGLLAPSPGTDSIHNVMIRGTLLDSVLVIDSARGIILAEPFAVDGFVMSSEWRRFAARMNIVLERLGTILLEGAVSPDSLDLTAQVDRLEMDLLQPFIPDIDSLSGSLRCRVRVDGSVRDPNVYGEINVGNLTLYPSVIAAPVSDGLIRITFDRRDANIDTVFARFGGGTIGMSGRLSHTQGEITDIDINTAVDNVKISKEKQFSLEVISGRFTYGRENDYYLFDGDVHLGESRLTADFPLQSILPWAQTVEAVETEYPLLLQKTRMNIRIRESDNLWIDNNLARVRLHSELAVIGSVPQPNFSGRVSVEEGYLLYLDRKFKILEGTVYFLDPVRFNPEVNFKSQTRVTSYQALSPTEYTITAAAEGRLLDDLRYDLTSEPPLDKADIVALLTLGATREQLTGKDADGENGAARSILAQRAQMLTSRKVSGYMSGKIGSLLGLDQVTVEGNLFEFGSDRAPYLTATKQLSERVHLTYSTTVGHMNDQSVQVGYRLSRRFFLEGQTDRTGRASLDLKYGLRFR